MRSWVALYKTKIISKVQNSFENKTNVFYRMKNLWALPVKWNLLEFVLYIRQNLKTLSKSLFFCKNNDFVFIFYA